MFLKTKVGKRVIVFSIILILSGVSLLYYLGIYNKIEVDNEILTYSYQTHEYYDFISIINVNKYYIADEKGYETFSKYFFEFKTFDLKKYLQNNHIFIQVDEVGSGSIKERLSKVTIDQGIAFTIEKEIPEFGTTEMALWYLIAIIPNGQLEKADYTGWRNAKDLNSLLAG